MFELMESQTKAGSILDRWHQFSLDQKLSLVALVLGVVFGLFGMLGFFWQANFQSDEVCILPSIQTASASAKIWVDIGGAVRHPGVYQVEYGSRLADLVNKAGGFSKQADKYYLNKQLNLAQRLTDEAKVYIPTTYELKQIKLKSSTTNQFRDSGNQLVIKPTRNDTNLSLPAKPATKLSINQASLDQLTSLNGIGEVRAKKIIDNRPYTSIDELLTKKVLPESVYKQNINFLVL